MLTFLAADVEMWQSPEFKGNLVEKVARITASGTNITIRAYNPETDEIWLMDFSKGPNDLPTLGRISQASPTPDDRAYLAALEEWDIRPVDVKGAAFRG